jgi:hypothetical protein
MVSVSRASSSDFVSAGAGMTPEGTTSQTYNWVTSATAGAEIMVCEMAGAGPPP